MTGSRIKPHFFATVALLTLSACNQPLDFDLRGLGSGFSTAEAAVNARQNATRPSPDSNGVISYPNYQVALARRGDTLTDVAARVGLPPANLARYNGMSVDTALRTNEVIALPRRVGENNDTSSINSGTIATGEPISITTLANDALDNIETQTGTTDFTGADPSDPINGLEPVRHQIQRGETAYTIARKYNISVRSLADWNGLDADLTVQEGRYLLIPVAANTQAPTSSSTPTQPGRTVAPAPPSASSALPVESLSPVEQNDAPQPSSPILEDTSTQSSEMQRPVDGALIRDFDAKSSKFVLFAAEKGTPVKAAKDGVVKLVSTNADGVKIIVVDHGNSIQTAYSFVDDINVSRGDTVTRGQTLANVTENEFNALQFMVFKGTQTIDPAPFF